MCEHLDIRERYTKGRGRVSVCQDCGEILISFMIDSGENLKQWDKAVSLADLARVRAERDALQKDVDAAIAGHLDYGYCATCKDMRYFDVVVAGGAYTDTADFRCRVCAQPEEAESA